MKNNAAAAFSPGIWDAAALYRLKWCNFWVMFEKLPCSDAQVAYSVGFSHLLSWIDAFV